MVDTTGTERQVQRRGYKPGRLVTNNNNEQPEISLKRNYIETTQLAS